MHQRFAWPLNKAEFNMAFLNNIGVWLSESIGQFAANGDGVDGSVRIEDRCLDNRLDVIFSVFRIGFTEQASLEDHLFSRLSLIHQEIAAWLEHYQATPDLKLNVAMMYSQASIEQAFNQIMMMGQHMDRLAFMVSIGFSQPIDSIPVRQKEWEKANWTMVSFGSLNANDEFEKAAEVRIVGGTQTLN